MKTIIVATACSALALTGCASTPDLKVSYYLSKSSPSLRVVRTVGCDGSGRITVLSSVVPATNISADPDARHTVILKDLDGRLANAEFGMTLLEDGRLSGVNATQTGQGSEIIKAGIQLASTLVPGGGIIKGPADKGLKGKPPAPPPVLTQAQQLCEKIRKAAGEEAGVPIIFESQGELFAQRKGQLTPTLESQAYYNDFGAAAMGQPCFETGSVSQPKAPIEQGGKAIDARKFLQLDLRQPASGGASVRVSRLSVDNDQTQLSTCSEKLWSGAFTLPQYGTPYKAALPRAVAFGKQSFSLDLSETGALKTIKYGKDNGFSSALGSANDVINGLVRTDADQAAQDQAAADAIAQHQRLLACRKYPAACAT